MQTTQVATLAAALRRFQQLFDHVPVALYRTTPDGRIMEANLAMVHLLGCATKEQLLAINARSFYVEPEARRTVKAELAATGVLRDFETELKRADGRRIFVRINARAIREDGIPLALIDGVMEDVTERKLAEAALHESEERLRQSHKMEAIGRLAGGVAHDFNNLLTAIIGYAAVMADDETLDDAARTGAGEILKAAERAAALAQHLLAFSRRQVLQPVVLSPDEVVAGAAPMLRGLVSEGVELVTSLQAAPATILADRNQLEQVLLNLVLNASDAMPEGGHVTIATAPASLSASDARTAGAAGPGDYVLMDVTDTGTGMTDAVKARIFEPYFTTKPSGKGTGLGLSTVYGIVRQSGGAVACRSTPGRGTTMRVMLPRHG